MGARATLSVRSCSALDPKFKNNCNPSHQLALTAPSTTVPSEIKSKFCTQDYTAIVRACHTHSKETDFRYWSHVHKVGQQQLGFDQSRAAPRADPGTTGAAAGLPPLLGAHDESFPGVQPVDPLGIHVLTLLAATAPSGVDSRSAQGSPANGGARLHQTLSGYDSVLIYTLRQISATRSQPPNFAYA